MRRDKLNVCVMRSDQFWNGMSVFLTGNTIFCEQTKGSCWSLHTVVWGFSVFNVCDIKVDFKCLHHRFKSRIYCLGNKNLHDDHKKLIIGEWEKPACDSLSYRLCFQYNNSDI